MVHTSRSARDVAAQCHMQAGFVDNARGFPLWVCEPFCSKARISTHFRFRLLAVASTSFHKTSYEDSLVFSGGHSVSHVRG